MQLDQASRLWLQVSHNGFRVWDGRIWVQGLNCKALEFFRDPGLDFGFKFKGPEVILASNPFLGLAKGRHGWPHA